MKPIEQVEDYFKAGLKNVEYQNYDKAINDFSESIRLVPNAETYYNRGFVYCKIEKYDKAIDDYTKAIKLKSDLVEAYNNRGCAYFKYEKHDRVIEYFTKAIDDFTEAIRLKHDFIEAYINRGCSYFKIFVYDKAIDDYTEAIKLKPDIVEAYINRGSLYLNNENYDKALEDFTEAIKLKPDADAYYRRSILYYNIKDHVKANNDYAKAKELNPAYAEEPRYRNKVTGLFIIHYSEAIKLNLDNNVIPNETNDMKTKSNVKPKTEIKLESTLSTSEHSKTQIQKNNQPNDEKKFLEKKRLYEYKKMKIFATSIFFLMVVVFILSHIFENQLTLLSYIKAFSEAAMIGALADWFAVVALFRKPLGFPYHTAIIPNNKDKMGESLGRLVQDNFLTPENIMEEFKNIDIAKEGIRLLREKKERLVQFVYRLIPELLDHIDKEEVKNAIINKIQKIKFTKVVSDIFELLTKENRHQDLLNLALDEIQNLIFSNKNVIINKIRDYEIDPGKWLPNFHIPKIAAKWIADAIISFLNNEFIDIKNDPFHIIRKKLNNIISKAGKELKENKDLQNNIDEKIRSVILNKTVSKYFDSMWLELKENIEEDLKSKDSKIKSWINSGYDQFVEYIEKNKKLSKEIDEDVKEFIKEILIEEKDRISEMISKKVKDTPKQEISDLIESYVGKDLQFIRINGTIVGGLVGLLIFLITKIL